MKTVLTGIQPTGDPHLGNWLGAMRPLYRLVRPENGDEGFAMVADLHARTAQRGTGDLHGRTLLTAALWSAAVHRSMGKGVHVFRQSRVPEIARLHWLLSCEVPKGRLDRSHAYKAAAALNRERGRDPDDGVSLGLFSYPVLMAADVLALRADLVPVGRDQEQHLELARDLAERLAASLAHDCLPVPRPVVAPLVPGTDGEKMSKSRGNTIPLARGVDAAWRAISRLKTDSTPMGEPLPMDGSTLSGLHLLLLNDKEQKRLRDLYASGPGWAAAKEALLDDLKPELRMFEKAAKDVEKDPEPTLRALGEGEKRARAKAEETLLLLAERP